MVAPINRVVFCDGGRWMVQRGDFTRIAFLRRRIRRRMDQRHRGYCRFRTFLQYLGAFLARCTVV